MRKKGGRGATTESSAKREGRFQTYQQTINKARGHLTTKILKGAEVIPLSSTISLCSLHVYIVVRVEGRFQELERKRTQNGVECIGWS